MRYRIGEQVDPDQPYPQDTLAIFAMSYWLSIPLGLLLLWLAIRGRVLWLKVWSLGLMMIGVVMLANHFFGFVNL